MLEFMKLEDGQDVACIQFGGDIGVAVFNSNTDKKSVMSFSNLPRKVDIGTDMMPEMGHKQLVELGKQVILEFDNAKSVDVVIKNLNKIKKHLK